MIAIKGWGRQLYYFLRLGRPLFLVGGFIFHGLGIAMALFTGAELNVPVIVWGQVVITGVQWMTHYSNEYFDLPADLANRTPTRWSGGSRILPGGHVSPHVALVTAVCLGGLAVAGMLVIGLTLETGPLTIPLLLLAILLAWGYSAPPLRLHSRGVGELTTAVLVPGLTPFIGFYLQSGRLAWLPVLAVFPLICFQFTMLLSINFPDAVGDAAVGKRTLVIRLGGAKAARVYILATLFAYLSLPVLVWAGLPWEVVAAVLPGMPIAGWLAWRMKRGDWMKPSAWGSVAFWSVGLVMGTAVLELATFLLLILG